MSSALVRLSRLRKGIASSPSTRRLTQLPLRYYFCREVATSARGVIRQYSLTTRRYLGPTSMDTEMALLMCNQARVRTLSLSGTP